MARSRRTGLSYRIARVYLLQVALVSLATIMGILATAMVIEHVLVKQALKMEAEHFWELYDQDASQSRPNTRHLLGLLQEENQGDPVPAHFQALPPGYHRVEFQEAQPIVYVEHRNDKQLYLIFDEQRVGALALLFGILPLSGVLLVIYLMTFLGWRKSRLLLSPLVRLSERLRETPVTGSDAARPDLSNIEAEQDSEVAVLVEALEAYADRLLHFVQRERQFTRDASHELRTPLAVVKANLELLQARHPSEVPLRRIHDTLEDMEALIETLLLLARSEQLSLHQERILVNDLAANLVERLQPLAERKQVFLTVRQNSLLQLEVVETMLTIVLTNLIRNAINYTHSGSVEVIVNAESVIVRDTGEGISPEELERLMRPFERGVSTHEGGYGLGLAIVQRLCERSQWSLAVASEPNQGTQVRVHFPLWQKWTRLESDH